MVATFTPSDFPIAVHPDRPQLKWRPLKAIHHFRELLKDKEDTEHVFRIFEALPRKAFRDEARAFGESAFGRELYAREPYLPDLLDDHDRLRQMPEGSVAHAYCDFMEKEGLSAAGLVAESAKLGDARFGDLVEWYGWRGRDTHDLLHVLTGYGRDAVGEQCVLAFTYGQSPAPAHLFIAYAGGMNVKKTTRTKAPVLRAVNEARALGRACPRIIEESITDLLAEPLDAARSRLNIAPARYYAEVHRVLREEGRDPYDLLARQPDANGEEVAQPA